MNQGFENYRVKFGLVFAAKVLFSAKSG